MFLYGQRGVQLFAAKPLVEVIWIRFRRMRKCAAAIWHRWSNPAEPFPMFWSSKNLSAGDFQELHLTGRALRSLESHKALLCTQQVVSIEAGSVGPCFYFCSWSGCWLFLRECFLLTFLCRRWSFRSYLSRIRFGHWGDFCPFSACMFSCWRQRFFGNDQVLHLNLSFFHLTALLLSYHSMNRITLLAERAGMVIRLMQLWVPQRGCLLGTMGRNRGFGFESWFVLAISVSAL